MPVARATSESVNSGLCSSNARMTARPRSSDCTKCGARPSSPSDGEEGGLTGTLEAHVETVAVLLPHRHERRPRRVVEPGQHRVGGVGVLLVAEVDAREEVLEQ